MKASLQCKLQLAKAGLCIGDVEKASTTHLVTSYATSNECSQQMLRCKASAHTSKRNLWFASSWLGCSEKFIAAHIIKHKLLYLVASVVRQLV